MREHPIARLLVLSATAQRRNLREIIEHFSTAEISGCLLTKLDEAGSLGPALSALIQARQPLMYTTSGQRVPEDLDVANVDVLLQHAEALMNKTMEEGVEPGLMAMAYQGRGVHVSL